MLASDTVQIVQFYKQLHVVQNSLIPLLRGALLNVASITFLKRKCAFVSLNMNGIGFRCGCDRCIDDARNTILG
jgi:hypothetical protein